jgi:hypothetical protein
MESLKTKSLKSIEERMENLDANSLRYKILASAKSFKTSWIELGQALYSVFKDKLYKAWGFSTFDAYTSREIGIRKQTAMKLLKSYYFLEKEEPMYLQGYADDSANIASLPNYETIDVLRLAKNKKTLDNADYARLKREIFEKGKDSREVRKDLTAIIRQREELEPEEARRRRKIATLRRFLGTLKSLKEEIEISKWLPTPLIKEAANLIHKLEAEIA